MLNELQAHPRRIPTEGIFLHYSIDDIVYGYLQASATYDPHNKVLYIPKNKMSGIKKMLQTIIGCKTTKTIDNKIKKLLENNLLQEGEHNNKPVILFPYDKNEKYRIIDADLLFSLVCVYRPMVLKIYVYLLDKYKWKNKSNEKYVFTLHELCQMMGYADSSRKQEPVIREILINLRNNKFIDYEEFYDIDFECGKAVPRLRLLDVCDKKPNA